MFYAHRSDRFKFIMCTNGRCGSTLLKRWYLAIHDKDLPVLGDHNSVHSALPYEDKSLHVARDGFNDHPYFKFVVVRNPWERLVSFYKVWVVGNQSNHEGLGRACSFTALIEQIEKEGPKDASVFPQFEGLEGLRFNKMVYLEDVQSGMKEVCQACNIKFDPSQFSERVFPAPVLEGKPIKNIHAATGHKIVESGHWPEWQKFYTNDLRDRVSKIYAKDIAAMGYGWPRLDGPVERPQPQKPAAPKGSTKNRRPLRR